MTDEPVTASAAPQWVFFRAVRRSSPSAHVLHGDRALCGGWWESEAVPAVGAYKRCRTCERALLPPTPKRTYNLSAVLDAIAGLHRPSSDVDGHRTCDAEGGEQDWPCETILHVRRALHDEGWPYV